MAKKAAPKKKKPLSREKEISLHLAGTVRFPAAPRRGKIEIAGDYLCLRETLWMENKQVAYIDRWVLLKDVSAVLVVDPPDDPWTQALDEDWQLGKEIQDVSGKDGIIFVPEHAPVIVESNCGEPRATLACELDDVEDMYGTPGCAKC